MKSALLALLVVTTLGLVSCDAAPPGDASDPSAPETLYKGRPVSHWLRQIQDLHWQHRDEAQLALIEFGGEEVAAELIPLLAHVRPEIVEDAIGVLAELEERNVTRDALRNGDALIRAWAAILLACEVTEWFGSYSSGGSEFWNDIPKVAAISRTRPDPTFRSWLEHEDMLVRYVGAVAYDELGGDIPAVVPALLSILADADLGELGRGRVAGMLVRENVAVERAVRTLVGLLSVDEDDSLETSDALSVLGGMGAAAKEAIPEITRLATIHEEEWIRDDARAAIEKIRER